MADEAKVPTIKLTLTNFEAFNVEIDFQTPSLEFARLMLDTARATIEKMQRDEEAIQFGVKMQQSAIAHQAMLKTPRIKM